MESPFSTILGPILVLWIGALVFYALDRFLQPQDRGVAEAIVLALAVGFALGARSQVGVPVEFGPPLAELGWEGMPPFLVASQTVGFIIEVDAVNMIKHVFCFKSFRMFVHTLHESRPLQTLNITGPVIHFGRRHELTAVFETRDNNRFEIGACGIDGSGVSGRT